jgi:hypothetical protein
MSSASLGDIFTSLATSVSSTQTELTDLGTKKQRQVRDVRRESRKKASKALTSVSEIDFYIYNKSLVKRSVYTGTFVAGRKKTSYNPVPLQHPNAQFVAYAQGPFGEGAERVAYRFYEIAAAKESRLVLGIDGIGDEAARKSFARSFCKTQQLSRQYAERFNEKLNALKSVDSSTPRVKFLDCSIYQIQDPNEGKLSVLVEERLDESRWQKWNSNNGYVKGMKSTPQYDVHQMSQALSMLKLNDMHDALGVEETKRLPQRAIELDFGTIEEEDEEESSDDEDYGIKRQIFSPSDVAQAFSHFTYCASGRKRLACDVQGVYDEQHGILKLSDPVIHYRDETNEHFKVFMAEQIVGRRVLLCFSPLIDAVVYAVSCEQWI